MPERSDRQENNEGALDKAAKHLKEATGSLTGGEKAESNRRVEAEGRHGHLRELEEAYKGYTVYDQHYDKIGKVDDLLVDENDQPEYIGVKMGFLLEQKTALIPIGIVRINDRRKVVEVAADKDTVQEAPAFDSHKDITPEYEDRVHGYFGLEREGSSPERGGYGEYYTSDFFGERYADQGLAGVDTRYGERAEPPGHYDAGIGGRTHGDLEQPPSQRDETADAEEQETTSVRVYKRVR